MTIQLTQSAIIKFLICPKAYWFRYVAEIVPDKPKSKNLLIGEAVHNILEDYYNGIPMENAVSRERLSKLKANDKALVKGMLFGYPKRYPHDRFKPLELEKVFYTQPYPDLDMIAAGKKDGKILTKGKKKALLEHKTTRAVTSSYIEKLDIDFQCLFYLTFGDEEFIEHVLYNVIEKAQFRQKQKESNAEFRNRLINEYETNPARYYRFWLFFSKEQQKEFKREVREIVEEIIQCHNNQRFRRSRNACYPYIGAPCEYQPLCFDLTNEVIQKRYIRKPPFEELEEENAG